MLKFNDEKNEINFIKNNVTIAVGYYENGKFTLLYNDKISVYNNDMQAFRYLNDQEFPLSKNIIRGNTEQLINLLNKRG